MNRTWSRCLSGMEQANGWLNRHLLFFVMSSCAIGLLWPNQFSLLDSVTVRLFAFMTFSSSLNCGFRQLGQVLLHPLPVLVSLFSLHIVMPLLIQLGASLLFPNDPLYVTGLVLEASVPTAISALLWVGISGGNTPLSISLVLLDTLIAPVVTPLTLKLLQGSTVEVNLVSMLSDMIVMVAIPALAAMACNDLSHGKAGRNVKPRLDFVSKIALMLLIAVNSAHCSSSLRNIRPELFLLIAATVSLCAIGYFLGYGCSRLFRFDYPTTASLVIGCGMRNISAGSVLAIQYFPPEVMFPVAFTQLFIHITALTATKLLMRLKRGRETQA